MGVGIKILSDFDMASVLTVKRRLKIYVFLMFQSCAFQIFHTLFRVKRHGLIVLPDGLFCFFLLRHYCIIGDLCHFVISSVNIVHCKSLSYKYTLFSSKKCPVSPDALWVIPERTAACSTISALQFTRTLTEASFRFIIILYIFKLFYRFSI